MGLQVIHDQYQVLINGWPITDLVAAFSVAGLIVGWWLSSSARKESARANTLQSLPIVTLDLVNHNEDIQVSNIGSSPATNIKVDPYYHPMYDDMIENKGEILSLNFKKVPLLLKDQKQVLEITSKIVGIIDESFLKQIMVYSKKPLIFTIRYRDLSGRAYFVRIKIVDATVSIVTAPTKYSIFRKLTYLYYRIAEQVLLNTRGRYQLFKFEREAKKKNNDS